MKEKTEGEKWEVKCNAPHFRLLRRSTFYSLLCPSSSLLRFFYNFLTLCSSDFLCHHHHRKQKRSWLFSLSLLLYAKTGCNQHERKRHTAKIRWRVRKESEGWLKEISHMELFVTKLKSQEGQNVSFKSVSRQALPQEVSLVFYSNCHCLLLNVYQSRLFTHLVPQSMHYKEKDEWSGWSTRREEGRRRRHRTKTWWCRCNSWVSCLLSSNLVNE